MIRTESRKLNTIRSNRFLRSTGACFVPVVEYGAQAVIGSQEVGSYESFRFVEPEVPRYRIRPKRKLRRKFWPKMRREVFRSMGR